MFRHQKKLGMHEKGFIKFSEANVINQTMTSREVESIAGWALNAVRVVENAKSVRKCVRFGLACVRLHGSVRFVFGSVFVFMFVFMFVFGVRVHVRGPILRKSTNSTHGKRASFSQNSRK